MDEGISGNLVVDFRNISFKSIQQGGIDPVPGMKVYVYYAGYVTVDSTDDFIVPLGSDISHKAYVSGIWSSLNDKTVDASWETCAYEWDGSAFSDLLYD